jgi:uncharacterized membrane protein
VWIAFPIADILSTLLTGYFLKKRNEYQTDSNQLWNTIIQSLHLIFVITWFAGLFNVRLFVYQIDANKTFTRERNSSKQYKIMTYRLWYYHLPLWQAFCFLDVVLLI